MLFFLLVIISLKFSHIWFLTWVLNHLNHISYVSDDPFGSDKKPHCGAVQITFGGEARFSRFMKFFL